LRLDDLDRQILAILADDARRSYAQIGAVVSLSAPAVKRRVDRLRRQGVIRRFTAVVDPASVGWTTEAFVEVFCQGRTSPNDLAAIAQRHPEIVAAYTVTGEADALVHLRTSDIRHLEQVLERIRDEPAVSQTRSTVVLSRLVERSVAALAKDDGDPR
jgi:DNA-binding Lrp family transcriptional regulator